MAPFWRKTPDSRGRTASGRVIDLGSRDVISRLSATKMGWQADAWNSRKQIGELAAALRLKANIISKVSFVVAEVTEGEDEPRVLTGDPEKDKQDGKPPGVRPAVIKAAIDCLNRLPFRDGYAFQGKISQGFDVAGECWMHGFPDENGIEQWKIRSTSEVLPSTGGLGVIDVPGRAARPLNAKTESLIRLWVPDPEWSELADSPLRSMLDVCEDIVLTGREIRAAAMSRIAANGLLLIPNELTMLKHTGTSITAENDDFQAALTAGMTAPISNEGDAGAVVPMVIRGDAEDLKEVRHVTIEREASPQLTAKLTASLSRLADGLDLPPEAMNGVGDANHWSAWLIDAQTFKNHVEPSVRMMVDAITESYFRRWLQIPQSEGGYGLSLEDALSVQVWYDAGNVTENANRSADADAAMNQGAISYKSYRAAKGFGEEDAPEEEDLQQIALMKAARIDPISLAELSSMLLGTKVITPASDKVIDPNAPQQITQAAPPVPPAGPGQAPANPIPAAPPAARAASGAPEPKLIVGDDLAEIDRQLRDRVIQAGDAAVLRALEKAGARIKSKAQGTELAAVAKGIEPTGSWTITEAQLLELGVTEDAILGAAFILLEAQFAKWAAQAVKASVKTAAKLVTMPLTQVAGLTQTMTGRIPAAWKRLEGSLRQRALDRMYGRKGDEMRGEVPDSIVQPGDVRAALSEIGGGGLASDGGLALGPDITRVIDTKATRVGFTWRYGITPRDRQFEPHLNIAGDRFSGFNDPALTPPPGYEWVGLRMKPGDHQGCFPAGTVVSGARPVAGFERAYVGEGVQIRTDAGQDLTGTPNHPVLTPRGWVPLGELQEGDELVVASGDQGPLPVDEKYQQVPALIDHVAATLPMAGSVVATPVPTAAEDFHGDGAGSEVTVVRTDGGLLAELDAARVKLGSDDVLQFAREGASRLASGSVTKALVEADGPASSGSVDGSEASAAFVEAFARPAVDLGGTVAATFDADGVESVEDRPSVDAVPSGESLRAFAGEVSIAKVVEVNRVALTGHVYNLNTLTGWYVANGVIASNCMCDYVPTWQTAEADEQARRVVGQESGAMAGDRMLAELDDAAGRTGTHSQRTRDERDRMVAVQTQWLER